MDYQWIKMVTKNGIQKTKEKRNESHHTVTVRIRYRF